MNYLFFLLIFLFIITLIVLDVQKRIFLLHPFLMLLYIPLAINLPLFLSWLLAKDYSVLTIFLICLCMLYLWIRLNIFPVMDGRSVSLRLKIMLGGRTITYCALWAFTFQLCFIIYLFKNPAVTGGLFLTNVIYSICTILFLFWNGLLRMFFTSKRLSILRRLLLIFTMWIPLVNLIVFIMVCRLIYAEYDFACYKQDLHLTRVDSDICKTRYPIVMVHGVFFRDIKYFNYWGRIPRELIRYGASIYYGNQEAVGTIVTNAHDIQQRVCQILAETGSEKVNIIAHSKGGLDSRYAISKLGLDDKVASLTTMNTPHRGCRFVDKAMKLPESLIRFIGNIFDNTFRRFGDKNPDFYNAVHQFTTSYSEKFNEEVLNSPKVYYQSFMSQMSSLFSDSLLCFPHCLIKPLEGDNDGLVSVASAKWGDFRCLFQTSCRRGISHGDIIDLKREDYKDFDVIEAYVNIVAELKKRGF